MVGMPINFEQLVHEFPVEGEAGKIEIDGLEIQAKGFNARKSAWKDKNAPGMQTIKESLDFKHAQFPKNAICLFDGHKPLFILVTGNVYNTNDPADKNPYKFFELIYLEKSIKSIYSESEGQVEFTSRRFTANDGVFFVLGENERVEAVISKTDNSYIMALGQKE